MQGGEKTSAAWKLKELMQKLYSTALLLMESYLHAKFEVYRCYGFWVSHLQLDHEKEEYGQFKKITFTIIVHIHWITSDFW